MSRRGFGSFLFECLRSRSRQLFFSSPVSCEVRVCIIIDLGFVIEIVLIEIGELFHLTSLGCKWVMNKAVCLQFVPSALVFGLCSV